ncbi:HD domain-containing protein [Patescibacteria group bacterium]|nr:HD domain-containing protein [Patescibacteria group bacterium]
MLSLEKIKDNSQILEFIRQSHLSMQALGYTEHGLRHASLVAKEAQRVAADINLKEKEQQLASIAGFCHDMGNFLGRSQHHYWSALLFHQIFSADFSSEEMALLMQAIANHDKYTMKLTNNISALVVLADKADVHRERVSSKSLEEIKKDKHNRVNYAVTKSDLRVNFTKKQIALVLKIDTNFVPVMEYFEIFTERMAYCRKAAEYLGYKFGLIVNGFKLL